MPQVRGHEWGTQDGEWATRRLTESLRGLLKRELRKYGGVEKFVRWIRSDAE
jgi:frataxin-like iron-binding protein CyaY